MNGSTIRRRRWVLALAAVASLMTALDTLVVATALTTIQRDLGARPDQLEWTVNTYNLVVAVLLLPAAALGDRFGRRRTYAAGLAVFTASSAVCALAPNAAVLVAGRAGQGAGAAFVIALGLALVSSAYPAAQRGAAIGLLEAGAGVAILAGPVLGGIVTQLVGWEAIFWLNVPIGLVLVPLVLVKVPESTGAPVPIDGPGLALVAGAVLAAMWGISQGNAGGLDRPAHRRRPRRGRCVRGRVPGLAGAVPRTRCCRCTCCATAGSAPASPPSLRCSCRCSAALSSSGRCSRSCSASTRCTRAWRCCRGRR